MKPEIPLFTDYKIDTIQHILYVDENIQYRIKIDDPSNILPNSEIQAELIAINDELEMVFTFHKDHKDYVFFAKIKNLYAIGDFVEEDGHIFLVVSKDKEGHGEAIYIWPDDNRRGTIISFDKEGIWHNYGLERVSHEYVKNKLTPNK